MVTGSGNAIADSNSVRPTEFEVVGCIEVEAFETVVGESDLASMMIDDEVTGCCCGCLGDIEKWVLCEWLEGEDERPLPLAAEVEGFVGSFELPEFKSPGEPGEGTPPGSVLESS